MAENVAEKSVENVLAEKAPNVTKLDAFRHVLYNIPSRRWLGLGTVVAAAIYLHYYTRDDRRYRYVRKQWVRKIVSSLWFPREGESWFVKLINNFLKIPERIDSPAWNYVEVNANNTPVVEEPSSCKAPNLYLDGAELYDTTSYYTMQALRVFGHFDKESLCEILRESTIQYIRKGDALFGIGHEDLYIYVVLRGRLDITLLDTLYRYKTVTEGGHLLSLVSLIALATEQPLLHRGLEAKATLDTDVVVIPYLAVFNAMKKRPGHLFYILRRSMERTMAVLFKTMGALMGLDKELMDERCQISRYVNFDLEIGADLKGEPTTNALQGVMTVFGMKQEHFNLLDDCKVELRGKDEPVNLDSPDGTNIVYYIHAGEVKAEGRNGMTFYASKGELLGGIALIANIHGLFTVTVPKKALLVCIPYSSLLHIFALYPMSCVKICKQIVTRFSWFTMIFALGLEWKNLQRKTVLFRQGEVSHSIYLVLSGRLRSYSRNADGQDIEIGEAGNDDWIGLFEAVTNTNRRKLYKASRDSDLAVIPASLIEYSKIKFAPVTTNIFDFVCRRLARHYGGSEHRNLLERKRTITTCSIFVLPLSAEIPMSAFGLEIIRHHSLKDRGIVVSSFDAQVALKTDLDKESQYELSAWATRLEQLYPLVIYLGDFSSPYYNLRCILQADRVLLVTDPGKSPPDITELEKTMMTYAPLAKKDLILIYKRPSPFPNGTKAWLEIRPWINKHHHLRFEPEFFNFPGVAIEKDIRAGYKELSKPINLRSDMSRLSRWLTGSSVALVMGGGGAKGAAQIGFLRTLLSLNLPIDMMAGVSIGSLIAAHLNLYDKDIDRLERDMGRWFKGMDMWWLYILDSTLIYRSLVTGDSFNQTLQQMLGGIQIEDMWTPFFCVSTDMTDKCAKAHYQGTLWEYVRASMNLAGYFQPYRDPQDGHFLMDGGYIQLVPIDFMRNYGAKYVLAVDISSGKGVCTGGYGDSVSGVEAIANRLLTGCPIPSWYEMSIEMTFIQSAFYLNMICKLDAYNIYIKLPTELFSGESFSQYEEIVHWGYRHGQTLIKGFDPKSPFPLVWARLNQFADPCFQLDKRREVYRKTCTKKVKNSQYDGDEFDNHKWDTEIFGPMFT